MGQDDYCGECNTCVHWNPDTWVCSESGECEPPSGGCKPSEGYEWQEAGEEHHGFDG